MKNRKYELVKIYQDYIEKCEENFAVDLAHELGTILWLNNLGIYSLSKIEQILIEKVSNRLILDNSSNILDGNFLLVATEIYLTGGHSRLIENISTFFNEGAIDLIIINKAGEEILKREKTFFKKIHNFNGNGFSNLEKIGDLSRVISKYDTIILCILPNDIITTISCAIAKKINNNLKIYFVNHSDHSFSYGSTISDVWFEISLHGIQIDFYRNLKAHKSFLGIPVKVNSYKPLSRKFSDGDLILSAGSFVKYKPSNGRSLMPLINGLLSTYKKSKFLVIGIRKYRDYWWWFLKFKYWNRLILTSKLPFNEYLNVTQRARLYLDSHPFPGGTAFVEQFLNGEKLCTGLLSPFKGYTPLEKHKKEDIESVIEFIERINLEEYNSVFSEIHFVHSFENVQNRFLNSLKDEYSLHPFDQIDVSKVQIIVTEKIEIIPVIVSIKKFKLLYQIYLNSKLTSFILFILKKLIYNLKNYR